MDNNWQRTFSCGELRDIHIGEKVILNGWISRLRNHGSLVFISLRDRYGITQITLNQTDNPDLFKVISSLKLEYCVSFKGTVQARNSSEINPEMATGEIEVIPYDMKVFNTSETLPFMVMEENKASDTLKLQYRYIGLRNPLLQKRLEIRSKLSFITHTILQKEGFIEVETPTFVKSTPEGARDFIIPSRMHKGKAFALSQSPQLFKQMLMMGGIDRYYQIARCYRDEDPRGDRQPEFTQIDLEMSFVTQEDVLRLTEKLIKAMFKEVLNQEIQTPFPRMTYQYAMETYGSDKPDIRFNLLLKDVSNLSQKTEFPDFTNQTFVYAIHTEEPVSRKQLSELEKTAQTYGLSKLLFFKVKEGKAETGIAKFITSAEIWIKELSLKENSTVILAFGKNKEKTLNALGQVRLHLGKILNLIDYSQMSFLWVDSFPLFEKDELTSSWIAKHHMFSRPQSQFIKDFESKPEEVLGELYDLVANGWEIASGSIRIHEKSLQKRIFDLVGFSQDKAQERFGYFLEAMTYGAPPHGGIALGFDRLVALMTHQPNIREVIAFPRNSFMASPLDGSPSFTDPEAFKEIGIRWESKEETPKT